MGTEAELATLKSPHDIVFTTERLRLRPVNPLTDLHLIHRMRKNPNSMKYMSTGVDTEEDPFKSASYGRIKLMVAPRSFSFCVELLQDATDTDGDASPTMIGLIGLFHPPALGYLFDEPYWGRGYATETLSAYIQLYWDHFPHGLPGLQPEEQNILMAGVVEGNVASERVLLKVGFKECGKGKYETVRGLVDDTTFRIERPGKAAVSNQAAETVS